MTELTAEPILSDPETRYYTDLYSQARGERWVWHTPLVQDYNGSLRCFVKAGQARWNLFVRRIGPWRTVTTEGCAGPLGAAPSQAGELCDNLVRLAEEGNADRIQLQLTPDFVCDQKWLVDELKKRSFYEIPLFTTVVELRSEKYVAKKLRGNFRRYWNKTSDVTMYDHVDHELVKRMCDAAVENFTRTGHPLEEWKKFARYADIVNEGHGLLFHYHTESGDAFTLIRILDQMACYHFGCSNNSILKERPNQKLHCAVLKYLLTHNYKKYDVGLVPVDSWRKKVSPKEAGIAFFKQGLGGRLHPVSIWELPVSKRFCWYMKLRKLRTKLY